MSTVAIATADPALFEALRAYLVLAELDGIDDATAPLTDREAARDWLDGRGRVLLVLDSRLPATAGGRWDHERAEAASGLLSGARDSGIATPILVITQVLNQLPDLEAACTPEARAIALPWDALRSHRAAVLRPFLAMIMRDVSGACDGAAIAGTFRVVEVEFSKNYSICSLGYADGTLLKWSTVKQLTFIRQAARIFSDIGIYGRPGWTGHARLGGEALFRTHVMDAIGAGLFLHIEHAAGGLAGLSFRFVITDPALYPAPFEASVRSRDDQDGPFVLLNAPVVRRLPPAVVIHVSPHRTARIPRPVRVLFIRSQMCEHPDGEATEDYLRLPGAALQNVIGQNASSFHRLDSIDAEMATMHALADRLGSDRMVFDPVDLSHVPDGGGTAAQFLLTKLDRAKYDVIHYAGHAWSSGMDSADQSLLVLPGENFGEASALPIEELARHASRAETRFIYLSACRGSSTRSVQSLVVHGIPHALGFRADVDDAQAAAFAGVFYGALFADRSLCAAFCEACAAARRGLATDEEDPIWITPILLAQTADWAMRF
jgi:hypothetical protein